MKKLLVVFSLFFTAQAFAVSYDTAVVSAKCDVVAKTGSTAGALTGGAVGGTVGAAAGKAMFGKGWGSVVGGLIGGASGAYVGNEVGSEETFHCILEFKDRSGKSQVTELVSMKRYVLGQRITVFEASDGSFKVK